MAQILQADSVDYLLDGRIMMKNGRVDKYLFEGGYAQASVAGSTTDNFAFYYYNRDHLGSIREVVDASGKVKQVTNYYPFGAPYADTSSSTNPDFQPYKYNGKELDRMHGLDTYDYGSRQHDPILARWDRMDLLCEKTPGISPYNYCNDNPIKNVDGNGEEPTTYEAALMAKHVYGDDVKLAGGWHLSKTQHKLNNPNNGFKSALYERTVDGVTEYTYATAGTENLKDIKEDALQLVGNSSQYKESVDNARTLSQDFANQELTFVGHSLGGGMAAANALATDRNAITFNPAAITEATKNNLGLPTATTNGRILNVIVKGEIVNHFQSKVGLKTEGGNFYLKASYLPGKNLVNTALRVYNHQIGTVIKKIVEEQKK